MEYNIDNYMNKIEQNIEEITDITADMQQDLYENKQNPTRKWQQTEISNIMKLRNKLNNLNTKLNNLYILDKRRNNEKK